MSYDDQTQRFGGNTIASYNGPYAGDPSISFGNFQLRLNTSALVPDCQLRALTLRETVLVHNETQWDAGSFSHVGGSILQRGQNLVLTQAWTSVGDPGIQIPRGEWRTYNICPVSAADKRWYLVTILASSANTMVRMSVDVLGERNAALPV